MNATENHDKIIVAFTAPTSEVPHFVGRMIGHYNCPVALIDTGDGRSSPWALHLCRPATPEEAEKFWKDRALAAEEKLRRANDPAPPEGRAA